MLLALKGLFQLPYFIHVLLLVCSLTGMECIIRALVMLQVFFLGHCALFATCVGFVGQFVIAAEEELEGVHVVQLGTLI